MIPNFPLEEALEKLEGYPETARDALKQYAETGDHGALEVFVIEVVKYYQEDNPDANPIDELPDSASLRDDVGLDSVQMIEAVFMFEDLFDLEIPNEELIKIETIGDVKAFFLKKLEELEARDPDNPAFDAAAAAASLGVTKDEPSEEKPVEAPSSDADSEPDSEPEPIEDKTEKETGETTSPELNTEDEEKPKDGA